MPLIQMPLQAPPPPPPDRNLPEQGDLFDAVTWESAYREMHDFPTLLIQARDELARSRKREAFWVSLVVHLILLLVIANSTTLGRYLDKYLPHRTVILANTAQKRDLTFLEMPSDLQKAVKPPKTNVMSDKTRVAESRAPKLDREQMKRLLDVLRQGRRGPSAAPPQQQATPAPAQQAAQAQPQQQPQPPPPQTARMQSPPVQQKSPFDRQPMSAERQVYQAAQQAASSRGRFGGGDDGDMGLGQRQSNARVGPYEILSDTMGVDFGPYLQRVLQAVRENWYAVIPPSAMPPILKRGKVSIDFSILKNGQAAGIAYVSSSGDVALDRAAYGGITASNPFPPLPSEFAGQALRLRFTFLYNPDFKEPDLH